MPDTHEALKKLLSKGETKQVIKQLLALIASDSPQRNMVVLLSGQFTKIENQSHLNLADPKQINMETDRINAALVAVIDTLSETDNSQVKSFWKRLSWLGLLTVLIGFLACLYYIGVFPFKNPDPPIIVEPTNPGPFPDKFDSTTLYILITRFEDYANVNETECYGRGIESRVDVLKNQRNLPVRIHYVDSESPNQSDEAASLRDRYHADLIVFGKLRNAGTNCQSDGFCLKFIPSDTLIHYAGG
ncbi:MAG: hypothetical protein H7246_14830, partial [Phycisphaerae bacterium]|nr:hypothetical protein [Saprospiraceae bacterium]